MIYLVVGLLLAEIAPEIAHSNPSRVLQRLGVTSDKIADALRELAAY